MSTRCQIGFYSSPDVPLIEYYYRVDPSGVAVYDAGYPTTFKKLKLKKESF